MSITQPRARATQPASTQPAGTQPPLLPVPDTAEKYGYVERNLTFLTLTLVIGAVCLVFSQLRF